LGQQIGPIFEIPMAEDVGPKGWWESVQTYAVGAFDLVHYNDAFLRDRWVKQIQAGEATGPRGMFNYRWHTPATDLDDIAAAANEQARQDYANLQVTTGMFRLLSTAAWLRFLTTPPVRSQTVFGLAAESRVFRDEAPPTTAKSPAILGTIIEHPARLRRYEARNHISITTQEPGYEPHFRYRIVLRTIDSLFEKEGWDPRGYVDEVWRAGYEPTAGDPRCQRLRTELRPHLILSEVELYNGSSPAQAVLREGSVNLRATTFDWYVPVVAPWSSYADLPDYAISSSEDSGGDKKMMLGTGGVSIHMLANATFGPGPIHHLHGPAPLVATVADPFTELSDVASSGHISLDKAERRHVRIAPQIQQGVRVDWKLSWAAGKLEITLAGRPEDRPFQVHVVVEETVCSGEPFGVGDPLSDPQLLEQIHTPFVAEIVNQVVLVPEAFFTEERKALEKAEKNEDCHPSWIVRVRRRGIQEARWTVFGQTCGGRYLVAVIAPYHSRRVWRVVTARGMERRTRRRYQQWRRS
jgi:uncharacterized DUF497 family protein